MSLRVCDSITQRTPEEEQRCPEVRRQGLSGTVHVYAVFESAHFSQLASCRYTIEVVFQIVHFAAPVVWCTDLNRVVC